MMEIWRKKHMKKSIGEIHQFVDHMSTGGKRQPFFKRTRKILGIPVIPLFAVAASAVLITVLLTTYHVNIFGTINITGTPQETLLIYDTTPLIAETTPITVMDFTTLNPGDDLIATHTVSNLDGYDWNICFDLSHMPCQETNPTALWYGVWIEVQDHTTHAPITEIDLPSGATATFDYSYSVDPLFAEPVIDFPFDLRLTITQDETPPPEPASITVTGNANGGGTYDEQTPFPITYTYSNVNGYTLTLNYQSNGYPENPIAQNVPITGSYMTWNLPNIGEDVDMKIHLQVYDGATLICEDWSDSTFHVNYMP
jgi:hypothetical protein